MVDFMTMAPLKIGAFVRWGYEAQLKVAPWAYEATYRLWYLLPFLLRPVVGFVTCLTRRRLLHEATEWGADVVVTTYPLGSLTLGRARQKKMLTVPAVTFVTDFAVHPLWVHKGVDANICVHESSAVVAHRRTGRSSTAPGPLVPERFHVGLPDRARTRAALGVNGRQKLVLVVAGSWGVGEVEKTFDALLASGRYTPVAVCGRNEKLRRHLEARGAGIVIGWTDEMPQLMAAADVLVQNAGGLTCMEAFAAGLPVVSYNPIPGHGRENAIDMDREGVAIYATSADELAPALDAATGLTGRRSVAAARTMFRADPADEILALADAHAQVDEMARRRARRSVGSVGGRIASRAAVAVMSTAIAWTAVTAGVGTATAHGIGVAHSPRHANAIYLGVRLSPTLLADPRVAAALASTHATAVIPAVDAARYPAAVQRLIAAGVDVANGGWGRDDMRGWTRARADVVRAGRALRAATGVPVRDFVPDRRVDGFDLASARFAHVHVVVTRHRLDVAAFPPTLVAGRIYVFDAEENSPDAVILLLSRMQTEADVARVTATSLAALR
ncbi:MAG: Monogalactosyldiacylglycerol synthase [Acidimicrobiales bacterium]|nr:Monogalactosyldiacylglycerol synthase [Acidimicrobiales bacterium]